MIKVGIVGATGAVGRQMCKVLESSSIEHVELRLFASERSKGVRIDFRNEGHEVEVAEVDQMKQCDYLLMSAGGAFSKKVSKELAEAGCWVIDNSSAWRMDDDVALVVPEVNPKAIKSGNGGIIANPNCSTIQMVVALKPLAEHFGLEHVTVATYQSVSGSGQKGISELEQQNKALYGSSGKKPEVKLYDQQIASNTIPFIGPFDSFGYCEEEVKMIKETRKILEISNLEVLPTTVRVPVSACHGEVITVRLKEPATQSALYEAFKGVPGLIPERECIPHKTPTPDKVTGMDQVFVSRIRLAHGETESNLVQFWNIADNLRKGAATNAVQILELISS